MDCQGEKVPERAISDSRDWRLVGNGVGNSERGLRTGRPVTSQTLFQRFCSLKFLHAQHLGARSQPERSDRSEQGLDLFQRARKGIFGFVFSTE